MKKPETYNVKNQPLPDVRPEVPANVYELDSYAKATPYYTSYMAAWIQKPKYEEPQPVIIPPALPAAKTVSKRSFFMVLVLVLMVAVLAVYAVSFFEILPLYTRDDIEGGVGLNDIVYSAMLKFRLIDEEEGVTYNYYEDCLADIENNDSIYQVIAYYGVAVTLIVVAVLAIVNIFKMISALRSNKRKKIGYLLLLTFLFVLAHVACALVWSGMGISDIIGFVSMNGGNMSLGLAGFALLGLTLLAWFFSIFAYRKRVKEQ